MKIRGNTVGTTMPRPDWNQTNPKRADFILNKPAMPDAIVCEASGNPIVLNDSADGALKGLTLYGKNILPLNEVTVEGTYSYTLENPIPAGQYKFYVGGITSTNTSNTFRIGFYSNGSEIQALQVEKIAGYTNLSLASPVDKIYLYSGTSYSNGQGHTATWKDMMISIDGGAYVPYFGGGDVTVKVMGENDGEEQTLVVSVPNALDNNGFICEDFAQLHTYKPNTTINNDVGAIMKVEYVADTKAYIDNKFNELAAAIVNNI